MCDSRNPAKAASSAGKRIKRMFLCGALRLCGRKPFTAETQRFRRAPQRILFKRGIPGSLSGNDRLRETRLKGRRWTSRTKGPVLPRIALRKLSVSSDRAGLSHCLYRLGHPTRASGTCRKVYAPALHRRRLVDDFPRRGPCQLFRRRNPPAGACVRSQTW